MKEVSFIAQVGGDGECFRWEGISKKDKIQIVGEPSYEQDRQLEEEWMREDAEIRGLEFDPKKVEQSLQVCYPDQIMGALGVNREKRYRFTVNYPRP